MARSMEGDDKAYRAFITVRYIKSNGLHDVGFTKTEWFGPHVSIAQARNIRTRALNEYTGGRYKPNHWEVLDHGVEIADNWTKVPDKGPKRII